MNIDDFIRRQFSEVRFQPEDMHWYQRDIAVPFMREHPFSLILMDLGLGKTISSLTVIAELISNFQYDKVLVVAPLKVISDTWPNEIGTWRHTAFLNYALIQADNEVERQALARSRASVHLISRDWLEWLCELWGPKWPYRAVWIDESSSFKDHQTHRFKALAKIRNTPGLIERMHLLTATPAAETYLHLWPQVWLLDRGERLGKSVTKFRDSYFTHNKYNYSYKIKPGAEEAILEKIADITLVMKKADYLPMTEPTVIQRKVRLAEDQIEMIRNLERHFILKLPDGTEIEAKTAAILASMLLQMSSGAVYETELIGDWETEDLKKVKKVHHLHDHKIETLKEIYEQARNEGENLIVAYYFKSSLDRLVKAFPKAVVMDKSGKCIPDWNKGKIPLLLIHPQSAGHGLNLQYGGSNLVFFDLIYSLENYLQTIGRIDRQGQTKPVVVQLLVAEGTRDEAVAASLEKKEDAQEMLFAILKRLIRRLKKERSER